MSVNAVESPLVLPRGSENEMTYLNMLGNHGGICILAVILRLVAKPRPEHGDCYLLQGRYACGNC
ncbi:hypothetical protein BDV09DRAFT_162901 [Aspergillus tetrazonus]